MNIKTLVPDIYALLKRKDGWFTQELANDLSGELARRLQEKFNDVRGKPTLRLSQMGPKCPCHLWHSINNHEAAEALPPWAEIKYAYGHIIEATAISFAKASGHTVTGEQDVVSVDGIVGHRDCVIDGCIVDVKSSSSIGFQKFKDGSIRENDSFGYLDQLDGYLVGSANDPLVTVKDKAYLLVVDKTLGHMVLYEHRLRTENDGTPSIHSRIADYKRIVERDTSPPCTCQTTSEGESGNIRLDTVASYSPYKYQCFPTLRTFIYSKGPVYFTKVVKTPTYKGIPLVEVDRYGKTVYN